ncbi:MAG TPA: serine hydrolase [Puia sp.]|jgi:CubicO group peptidase (beta-lactamase class C family)
MTRLLLIGLIFVCTSTRAQQVVLNNTAGEIPIKSLPELTIASVHFNFSYHPVFDSIARNYWGITSFNGDTVLDNAGFDALHDKLKFFNTVFLECSANTAFNADWLAFAKDLQQHANVFIITSGDGNNLKQFNNTSSPIIWYPTDDGSGASLAAQTLFGGIAINNKLPETFSAKYPKGAGAATKKIRLGYAAPETVGVNSNDLTRIDSIVKAGIAAHAAPAVVIVLVKDGEVIYSKAFGKHKYWGDAPTKVDDIFDMASCTKVTATTPSIMHLYETHQIALDSPIATYVAALRNIPNKKDLRVREALLHEAGFTPYIKFYESLKPTDMSTDSSAAYPTKVADNYYLRANYFNDTQWPMTLASPVLTRGKYVYSDLSMYMMKEVFENVSHQRLNEYVLHDLYLPLGMQSTGFLPRNRFPKQRIVPTTENDNWFRNMPVQGYVNDPGAAMAGGVEGHAGLFASANDLAIYYQMLLNGGTYGGKKYFDSATVRYFTSRQSKVTYRGLGFDRTNLDRMEPNDHRSDQAFGHSGYTGTFVWVDPKYRIVYICLTNRVYPDDNKTFGVSKVNVRPLTLNAFYDAVVKAVK